MTENAGPGAAVPPGERVLLAHGGGGLLSHRLLSEVFLPYLGNPALAPLEDSSFFVPPPGRLAFTTDSFVVDPLEFPGGDIGRLAVCGTVNDLAAGGARPIALSAGFILEEGTPLALLRRILASLRDAAAEAGVSVVAGDTKVVPRGKGDGVYINTAGVGVCALDPPPGPTRIREGDAVLVSGFLGDHGVAVMAAREGLTLPAEVRSDCAPLFPLVQALLDAGVEIHALRDPTRGGLATTLNELAGSAGVEMEIHEEALPVREGVRAVCEILGYEPLYLANEGKMIVVVPEDRAGVALEALRGCPLGRDAARIGRVTRTGTPRVILRTLAGGGRILDVPAGELLPRIC